MSNVKGTTDLKAALFFIRRLQREKKDFKIYSTGYSCTIETENGKQTFLQNYEGENKQLFFLANMVKKDVRDSNLIIDSIKPEFINYYDVNVEVKKYEDDIVNVDIKSAYLCALEKAGLITERTKKALEKTDKVSRLKSVGMLATQKIIFEYKKGVLSDAPPILEYDENNRNVFFYISKMIDEFMQEIKCAFPEFYLCYWVDGIYFKKDIPVKEVEKKFIDRGYKFETSTLKNLIFFQNGNFCEMVYDDDKKGKKYFKIPTYDRTQKKDLINRMLKNAEANKF